MPTEQITAGYVLTDTGEILVQLPAFPDEDENIYGFILASDDQVWPGGFGAASSWELLADDDPRITDAVREQLGWLLD